MTKSKSWYKAMFTSLVIHAVILTSIAWLAYRSPVQVETIEQYIELDLSQETDLPLTDNQDDRAPAIGEAPITTTQVVPAAAAVPNVVPATSSLSVISAEVPVNVSDPSGEGAGGLSNGNSDRGQSIGGGSGSGGEKGAGNGGSGRGDSGYTNPKILSQVMPTYPESARRQGIQGTVMLKIQILSNGRAGMVSIYRSSGNDSLDDAAVDVIVQQWRFIPAKDRRTGEAITCVATIPIVFRVN